MQFSKREFSSLFLNILRELLILSQEAREAQNVETLKRILRILKQ